MSRWLEAADRIGCRLCRDAVWSGGRCNWLGWSTEASGDALWPVTRSCGADLYGGTAGIALFLAHLYAFTSDPIQRTTLEGALAQAREFSPKLDGPGRAGLYSGRTGVAGALLEAGRRLGREGLVRQGLREMAAAADGPARDAALDVIGGWAGAIPVWLGAAGRYGDPRLREAAVRAGKALLACARKSRRGWSWDTMQIPDQPPLLGYAHGTAGIARALGELSGVTGRRDFRRGALGALRYERAHFDARRGNWPDLRPHARGSCPVAWCHGAAGIALSRLALLRLFPDDERIAAELERALETTSAALPGPALPSRYDFSLCHGLAGNADVLLEASRQLERPALRTAAEQAGRLGLERHHDMGVAWPCGLSDGGETPGLMLGLAGIGCFILRLHDPEAVPTVLAIPAAVCGGGTPAGE